MSKEGNKCQVCLGCGKCHDEKQIPTLAVFRKGGYFAFKEDTAKINIAQKPHAVKKEEYQDVETGKTISPKDCIIAVDLGTTTIVMQRRNQKTGEIYGTYTGTNPQRKFGSDVLSRISAAEKLFNRLELMNCVQDFFQEGIRELGEAAKMVVAGNTAMVHFLMNYDTTKLGQAPFIPYSVNEIHTTICGMDTVILPGVSAFVGGDIIAGIHALSMEQSSDINLLVDLGTNGEMVLGNRERMVATSTAAGPAFEGNGKEFASDLMSYVDKLLELKLVDDTGLLSEPYFDEGILIGSHRVTRQDIRQLQMAKAAICCGIEILCKKYGITDYCQIAHVYLAGGMGYYLSPKAAAGIGLLPKVLAEKAEAVGNSSLEGAFLYGTHNYPSINNIECINLAEEEEFEEKYLEHMKLGSVG